MTTFWVDPYLPLLLGGKTSQPKNFKCLANHELVTVTITTMVETLTA